MVRSNFGVHIRVKFKVKVLVKREQCPSGGIVLVIISIGSCKGYLSQWIIAIWRRSG